MRRGTGTSSIRTGARWEEVNMGLLLNQVIRNSDVYVGTDSKTGERVAIKRHKMKDQDEYGV